MGAWVCVSNVRAVLLLSGCTVPGCACEYVCMCGCVKLCVHIFHDKVLNEHLDYYNCSGCLVKKLINSFAPIFPIQLVYNILLDQIHQ